MSKRDYYEVLGVPKDVDDAALKKAYRKQALKYHPDRNPDDPDAEEKLKEINEAFAILSDSQRRARYDRFGHEGMGDMGNFGGFDLGDLFGDLFGSIFGDSFRGQRGPARGQDLLMEELLTFEEAALGTEKVLDVPIHIPCDTCEGSGAEPGTKPEVCPVCRGNGEVRMQQGFFTMVRTCSNCSGSGQVIASPCKTCKGSGQQEEMTEVEVNIPPGSYDGLRIRLRGKGEPSTSGGPPGDLYILIRVDEHPLFDRDGDNVICEIPISFGQAALGCKVDVPTIHGMTSMKVPAGTQPGTVFRLKKKGIPRLNGPGIGDQKVRFMVEVPKSLNREQRELIEKFEELSENSKDCTPKRHGFLEKVKSFFHIEE